MELRRSHSLFQSTHWEFWVPCPKIGGALPCTQPLGLRSKPPTLAAWRTRMGCSPCVIVLTAAMCPDNLEKSRPKLIWNGLGFSSRHPFHLSLFGSNFCPVATFLCLLVAENNFESASEGLPFCWAEHFPNDFCYSISSLDDEHLFQLFPFGSALCSAQTTIKQGSLFLCSPMSFISIMNSFPTFLLIFLPQWWIPSVLVPVTQLLFCCPPYMAAPWCRVGTWKTNLLLIHTHWG